MPVPEAKARGFSGSFEQLYWETASPNKKMQRINRFRMLTPWSKFNFDPINTTEGWDIFQFLMNGPYTHLHYREIHYAISSQNESWQTDYMNCFLLHPHCIGMMVILLFNCPVHKIICFVNGRRAILRRNRNLSFLLWWLSIFHSMKLCIDMSSRV